MDTAKVFQNGRSQAVRIPKKFRFSTSTVTVTRQGDSLVLTPCPDVTWESFFAEHRCPEFELDREQAQELQERELFG